MINNPLCKYIPINLYSFAPKAWEALTVRPMFSEPTRAIEIILMNVRANPILMFWDDMGPARP